MSSPFRSRRLLIGGAALALLPLALMAAARARAGASAAVIVAAIGQGGRRSIQAAVDRARPGDLIVIGTGVYVEPLVIDKDLTLEGQGDVLIEARDRVCVQIKDAAVTLRNLTLRTRSGDRCVNVTNGAEARLVDCDVSGGRHAAVRVVESEALLRRCVVRDARVEGVNFAHARGRVEECCVHDNGSHGVRVEGGNSSVTLSDCTIYAQRGESVLAEARETTTMVDCRLSSPPNTRVAGRDNIVQRVAGCRMEVGPRR
jgi:nitrous oxidase accessory protein NosD